jgi:hypothetical protein
VSDDTIPWDFTLRELRALRTVMRRDRAWWAIYDPVAYVWLCRAERRGARVPWSDGPDARTLPARNNPQSPAEH